MSKVKFDINNEKHREMIDEIAQQQGENCERENKRLIKEMAKEVICKRAKHKARVHKTGLPCKTLSFYPLLQTDNINFIDCDRCYKELTGKTYIEATKELEIERTRRSLGLE